jgi:hypothetical protein
MSYERLCGLLSFSRRNHILLLWVLAAGVQTILTIIGYSFGEEKSLDLTGEAKRKA